VDAVELLSLDRRIAARDRLAADAVLSELAIEIAGIREALSEAMTEDASTLLRLSVAREAKERFGERAVLLNGTWTDKEAAATDRSGTEPRRSGVRKEQRQRATAGQLAQETPCLS
jgi:hypothetical protein